jgi:hypothetical protein
VVYLIPSLLQVVGVNVENEAILVSSYFIYAKNCQILKKETNLSEMAFDKGSVTLADIHWWSARYPRGCPGDHQQTNNISF